MEDIKRSRAASATNLKEKLIQKLEGAASENRDFAKTATQIIVLLTNYRADTPIPDEFWHLYRQLAKTVVQDASGKLLFSEGQMEVVYIIRNLMRAKGILVQLPDRPDLQAKLRSAARELTKWDSYLNGSVYPPVLEKAGEEMDIWFFLSLLSRASIESLNGLDGRELSDAEQVSMLSKMQGFQKNLIDSLVSNPYLADYAHQQVRVS